jgi:hypothetical protein
LICVEDNLLPNVISQELRARWKAGGVNRTSISLARIEEDEEDLRLEEELSW